MKRINIPLILGIIITLIIAAACFFPEKLTSADPYSTQGIFVDKARVMHSAPYPPSVVKPFGSDELGRNVYSQIVYGTRQTMKLVIISIIAILLLALPLGLTAGFGAIPSRWLLKAANLTSSAVPALILCIIILNLRIFRMLDTDQSITAFAIVIAAVGFGRMGTLIRQRVEYILNQPFIEGQVVMGKTRLQIAFQNVLPHLLPYLLVYLSIEAGRTLFLLCQLGIFNVFVGNLKFDSDTAQLIGRNFSYEPEWGTMLGTTITMFKVFPWLVLPLIICFFIGILGFNLLAEGLKAEFEKKNSHFIAWLKKLPYVLSPRIFIQDMRNIHKNPLPGTAKLAFLLLVLFIAFFPRQFAYYPFDYTAAFSVVNELTSDKYQGRRSGTPGRDMAADYIISKLTELKLKPGGKNGYLNEFSFSDNRIITRQQLSLSTDGNNYEELIAGKDYRIANFESCSFEGKLDVVIDGKNGLKIDSSPQSDSARLYIEDNSVKSAYFNTASSLSTGQKALLIIHQYNIGGALIESDSQYKRENIPIIEINENWKDKLMGSKTIYAKINVTVSSTPSSSGKNIIGVIPGTVSSMNDEFIVVGASYDGMGWVGDSKFPGAYGDASSTAICLEAAKAIMKKGPPKRPVVFAFWDYSERNKCGAFEAGRLEGFSSSGGNLYIELKHLGKGKSLVLDTSKNPPEMPEAQRLSRILAGEFNRLGFRIERFSLNSPESDAMRQRGMGAVVLESPLGAGIAGTQDDNLENVTIDDIKYAGQGLVNALIKMIY